MDTLTTQKAIYKGHQMKLMYLADPNTLETVITLHALVQQGYEVHLCSCQPPLYPLSRALPPSVSLHFLPITTQWGYFMNVAPLKKLFKTLQPDLVHADGIATYGTLGRLCDAQCLLVNCYAYDLVEFPNQSRWHKGLLLKNLEAINYIKVNSHIFAEWIKTHHANVNCAIIPTVNLSPALLNQLQQPILDLPEQPAIEIRLGSLSPWCEEAGLDVLLLAFKQLLNHSHFKTPLRLHLAGAGEAEKTLRQHIANLELSEFITLSPPPALNELVAWLQQLTLYIAPHKQNLASQPIPLAYINALGIPIITTSHEEALHTSGEIVLNNPSALAEKLLQVVNSTYHSNLLNCNLLHPTLYFSLENYGEQLSFLYQKVIQKR